MASIEVNSNKADRKIVVTKPEVLGLTTLEDLVEAIGEEICISQIIQKMKDSFRAFIRTKMEKTDEDGNFVNSDEAILNEDYSGWKPSLRVIKTPEEKAFERLCNLPPAEAAAVLAQFNAQFG